MIERENGAVTTDQWYVWCGHEICEERDASGSSVVKRFTSIGEQSNSQSLFYATDHLNSIRNLNDAASAVRASYDYDPYGRRG